MKKILFIILPLALVITWYGCKKAGRNDSFSDAPAPAVVSDVKVFPKPGAVTLKYTLPKDPEMLYALAVYEIQPGVFREAKASYFLDSMDLVGFGDTLSRDVKIYSVGKNEKKSEPLIIKVKPLTPPVQSVSKTLDLTATFGGVLVKFINEHKADLSIVVLVDTLGTWQTVTTHYTSAPDVSFAARGFDTKPKKFGVLIRDRWSNKSDTLIKILTPLEEQLIPFSLFKTFRLPTDTWQSVTPAYPVEKAFNGIVNNSEDLFATADNDKRPQWFTIDLGQNVIFSRMKLFQRTSHPYNAAWVKSFEIWGSNAPAADGSFNNWQLLGGTFESRKPSGLPQPQYTAADMDYMRAGEDFDFPFGNPPVRYIRFKMMDSYGGVGKYFLGELTFWGKIVP